MISPTGAILPILLIFLFLSSALSAPAGGAEFAAAVEAAAAKLKVPDGKNVIVTQHAESDGSTSYKRGDKEILFLRKTTDKDKDVIILDAAEDMVRKCGSKKRTYVVLKKVKSATYAVFFAYIR